MIIQKLAPRRHEPGGLSCYVERELGCRRRIATCLPLAADFVSTFRTAPCSQGPVALGSASSFAILAATTVTSAGVSTVVGDLGGTPGIRAYRLEGPR